MPSYFCSKYSFVFQYSGFLFVFILIVRMLVLVSAQPLFYPKCIRTNQDWAPQTPHSKHRPCFLGSRVLRDQGLQGSCPERVQFRDPLCNFPASVWPCSLALSKSRGSRPLEAAPPIAAKHQWLKSFSLCPDCVKLNKSQHLGMSFSKYEGRKNEDFKGHTNHSILPNYLNGKNRNKTFASNIFGSKGILSNW